MSTIYAILACEIAFWIILFIALGIRYFFSPALSKILLYLLPLVDLILLGFFIVKLKSGAPLTGLDILPPAYLGFTVAFGHSLIEITDRHIARLLHRPYQRDNRSTLKREAQNLLLWFLAIIITIIITYLLIEFIATPNQAQALRGIFGLLRTGTLFYLIFGPIQSLLEERSAKKKK